MTSDRLDTILTVAGMFALFIGALVQRSMGL